MHKLKLPNVSRSEVKGSIKITNRICKGLFIVYCSFNFGKENTTSGKTIEGQPYAFPPPQTSTETQIMMILIIYQTLPAALIENSHFNSKLVCLAMLKLYSKVLAKPSPLVSRWRASFQSRHAGIVWYILKDYSFCSCKIVSLTYWSPPLVCLFTRGGGGGKLVLSADIR